MTKFDKLVLNFRKNPEALNFHEIIKILNKHGYEERNGKGSHMVFKNLKLDDILTIPVHNNDCKGFYKKKIKKVLFGG